MPDKGPPTETAGEPFTEKPGFRLGTEHVASGASLNGRRPLTEAFFIERSRIRPDPLQPRRTRDPDADAELTASLRRLGVLQPITVPLLEEELPMIRRAQDEGITASDMEQLAAKRTEAVTGRKPRSSQPSRHSFQTSLATVSITFRKPDATTEEILAVLDEVQAQVCRPSNRTDKTR